MKDYEIIQTRFALNIYSCHWAIQAWA